jgi:dienelactone hydrolase
MTTPLEALISTHRSDPPKLAFRGTTKADFDQWHAELYAKLEGLLGLPRMAELWTCEPELREEAVEDLGDHLRQKMYLKTTPDYWLPFYVLRPKGEGPFVPIVAQHGHGETGARGVIGFPKADEEAEEIRSLNYSYGLDAVRRGYIVFAPDKRGFGETRDHGNACGFISSAAISLGLTMIGMHTWDNIRLLDYIATRDDCRPGPIGAIGLSGGGGGTMWLSAMDGRIGATVISGHLASFAANGGIFACVCNAVPGILTWADRGEVGGLIAPRPLLIESASNDACYSREASLKAFEAVKRIYAAAGVPDRTDIDLFEGEHVWSGAKAWPFLEGSLAG